LEQRRGLTRGRYYYKGRVDCDGSRGPKLPSRCHKVKKAIKEWLKLQEKLASQGKRNFKAAIMVAKGEIKGGAPKLTPKEKAQWEAEKKREAEEKKLEEQRKRFEASAKRARNRKRSNVGAKQRRNRRRRRRR